MNSNETLLISSHFLLIFSSLVSATVHSLPLKKSFFLSISYSLKLFYAPYLS